MIVLVINCGSSSIKYQLYDMPARTVIAKGIAEKLGDPGARLVFKRGSNERIIDCPIPDHDAGVKLIIDALVDPQHGALKSVSDINAVGHRVVHGGDAYSGSVKVTDSVIAAIERFADLAPLHNPPNLAGLRGAMNALPDIPNVACFDTAFHQTLPEVAWRYALPYDLYDKYKIRRYGFHGTSHRYVARRAAALMGKSKTDANIITAHLGNGCSMAAIRAGKSVDTSMGLTPLEGIVMGTRSGDFDPAILFYLADHGYTTAQLNSLCNKQSGLLGISGKSNDMRNLMDIASKGDSRAQLAIDIFCYRIKKYIGAYAAVLGRVDALVFTGGIGENRSEIRAKSCENLDVCGFSLDLGKNASGPAERDIQSASSRSKIYIIPTDEEAAIASDTFEIVSKG
jgi:acetate kinase